MSIVGLMVDVREPQWITSLTWGGLPVMIATLDYGDVHAFCDDGHVLLIERKSPSDYLNTLRDERLYPQLARLAEPRQSQQIKGVNPTFWPFLIITDNFLRDGQKVNAEGRETGWSWASLQGSLLQVQEMGVSIITCAGDADFESCIRRLGERNHDNVMNLLPPRLPIMWGPKEAFIASLPGIGQEKTLRIMEWAGNNLSHALIGLVDLSITCPVEGIGELTRKKIRSFLGLEDGKNIELVLNELDQLGLEEM